MNLREDINKFLENNTEGEYDTHYQTNEILNLFEKRIDSKIENSSDFFEIVAYKNMKEMLK